MRKKTSLSWVRYENSINLIIEAIKKEGIQFDHIVGIARGGMPILTSLASHFGVRDVGVIFMQKTLSDNAFADRVPEAICKGTGFSFDTKGKRVLLVDDILRSGNSVQAAICILNDHGAEVAKVISLFSQNNEYPFDYFAPHPVTPDSWIEFPWSSKSAGD